MPPDLIDTALKEYFGLDYLYPYQRLVISNILAAAESNAAGESMEEKEREAPSGQIVILPTGYGKSLCFMLPCVLIDKPTLVLFPLLSLIKDQERRLLKAGIEPVVLTGGLSRDEKQAALEKIKSGKTKIILTNPEALLAIGLENFTSKTGEKACDGEAQSLIGHIVIDEAHTIPDWGGSFREALLETGKIIETLNPDVVTAFTATASDSILDKIREIVFREREISIIRANPDRTNIYYEVRHTLCVDRDTAKLAGKCEKPLIVFCSSRTDTRLTARYLRHALMSREIFFYHAGLSREEKAAVEKWFFASPDGILVATCAYGMGVDKADIRTVIHRGPPASVEAYLQESGRAGRDMKESKAVMLFSPGDRNRARLLSSTADGARIRKMAEYADNTSKCRRENLLELMSVKPDYCSGCDICSGKTDFIPDGFAELTGAVAGNRYRLDEKSIVSMLKGSESAFTPDFFYRQSKWFSSLHDWEKAEIEDALKSLISEGKIKKGGKIRKGCFYI